MKNLSLIIALFMISSNLLAQTSPHNSIEMRAGLGGADGTPLNLLSMQLAYTRHIGYGLMLKPSLMIAQGGKSPIFGNANQDEFMNEYAKFQEGDQLPNTNFYQLTSFGLGLQKAINTDKRGSLNVMLGLRGTQYNKTTLQRINDSPLYDELIIRPQYSKEFAIGIEAEISYYHQLNDYLRFFVSGTALTKLFYFSGNLGLAVSF